MSPRPTLLLISSLSLPTAALLLTTYLYNRPLSASRSRQITKTNTICPSFASSTTVRKIVNPRHHDAMIGSFSIHLSEKNIGGLNDEEILARFVKGFFGGWTFYPERNLIALLGGMGISFGTKFSDVPEDGVLVSSFPLGLNRTSLPPKHAYLFGDNFLVLDIDIKSESSDLNKPGAPEEGSYIDVGFGDDRRTFAGVHRFEVLRDTSTDRSEAEGARILFSSMSCNPTVREATFPKFVYEFHKYYALTLFRDGIAELRD